jgi:hypothetical protein
MTTITLGTPSDVRIFGNETTNSLLVSSINPANYSNLTQAINWAVLNNNVANVINVSGPLTISSDPGFNSSVPIIITGISGNTQLTLSVSTTISNITFNNLNFIINNTTIIGSNVSFNNCTFTTTISKAFSLTGNNIIFNGCNVNYNNNPVGDGTYSTINLVNSSNAFIYSSVGTTSTDININKCIFTSSLADHYPFISFEFPNFSSTLQNCNVSNNKFISNITTKDVRAVISFISTINTTPIPIPLEPARMINCRIDKNLCDKEQMIIISSIVKTSGTTFIAAPAVINSSISDNTCGSISYMTRFNVPENYVSNTGIVKNKEDCLFIERNACKLIGSFNNAGKANVGANLLSNSGKVVIKENSCSWIQVDNSGDTGSDPVDRLSISIKDNILTCTDSTFISNFWGGGTGPSNSNTAIWIFGADSDGYMELDISNNKFNNGVGVAIDGVTTTTYSYYACVNIGDSAKILDNNFNGIINSTTNSVFIQISPIISTATYFISGNKFVRNASGIKNYIISGAGGNFTVVNNFFDSSTVDGSSTTLSNFTAPSTLIYERNKNQTSQVAFTLGGFGSGLTSIGNINTMASPVSSVSTVLTTVANNSAVNLICTTLLIFASVSVSDQELSWTGSIPGLPNGVKILNSKIGAWLFSGQFSAATISTSLISTSSSTNILDASAGAITNSLQHINYDAYANQAALSASSQTITLDVSSASGFITSSGNTVVFNLHMVFNVYPGSPITLVFSPVVITYIW